MDALDREETNLGCCTIFAKNLLVLFNCIFFMCGCGLIVVGGVVQAFFSEYVQFFDNKFETPATGIIILGVVIMIISLFGCCGAYKQSVCLLNTFAAMLVLMVMCEVAALITVAVLRAEVSEAVQQNMKQTLEKYDHEQNLVTTTWDNLQHEYDCCGVQNYEDWFATKYGMVPESCCKHQAVNCTQGIVNNSSSTAAIFTKGCYSSLEASAFHNLSAVTIAAGVLALLQIIGIWMACSISKKIRNSYEVLY